MRSQSTDPSVKGKPQGLRSRRGLSTGEAEEIITLFKNGMTGTEIARQKGLYPHVPYWVIRKAGVNPIRFGVTARSMTDAAKREVVRLYSQGRQSTYQIAGKMNVSATKIKAILKKSGIALRGQRECHRTCSVNEAAFDDENKIKQAILDVESCQ